MYSDTTWEFYDSIKQETRLQLLVGVPQNIAILFMEKPTISSVYLIQAGLVFVVCMTMMEIFNELNSYNRMAFYSIVALALSKAFVFSFYHPVLAESLLIVFLAATILFYLRFINYSKSTDAALLIIFAILACVSKISGAFILSALGMAMVFSDLISKQRVGHRYIAHFILIVFPLIWFVITGLIAGKPISGKPADMIVLDFNYLRLTWNTDAVVFLLILPLGIVLPILGLLKRGSYDIKTQICSCLCLIAVLYAALLILYGKHSDYHLAPVYFLAVFIVPRVAHELMRLKQLLRVGI
jgi:hypothetical protein